VLRDVRNDGDSDRGTAATLVGVRTGGAAVGPGDGAVRGRSVRRERRPGAWRADFKMLRCVGTLGRRATSEGTGGPNTEDGTTQARRARARGARDVAFWRRNCFNVALFESEKLQKFE
jgi:hypothetical protein